MAVIRLGENEKEIYLKNLIMATEFLTKSIKDDNTLIRSEWDRIVYDEMIKKLEYINKLFYLLRRNVEDDDYKNNFGIYKEIVLSNGGLPEFFSYRQLLEDKNLAEERIKQVLESEDVTSKEDLARKWIERANSDTLSNIEEKREYLLEKIPEKFRTIEFYEKIKDTEIFNIRDSMKKLSINPINIKPYGKEEKEEKERYLISWFNYTTGFGIWNIYVMQLCEKNPNIKRFLKIFIKDDIPSSGHFVPQEKSVYIDFEFKKFLEDHMSSGVFFLGREIDKTFPTIYPERISRFQFGPNFVKGISSGSLDFSWLFVEHPDAFFLTAIREDIQSNNNIDKKGDSIYVNKIIGTKCSWKTDKFFEQRFGICSKELETALKEYIKFPDMRFYII